MKGYEGPNLLFSILLALFVVLVTFSIAFGWFSPDQGPATKYDSIISQASFKYGVEVTLIKAVIFQESNFKPSVVSGVGAIGLMQILPKTAAGLEQCLERDCELDDSPEARHCKNKGMPKISDDLFDPEKNINGGTCYLSFLLKKYNNNKELALAAYNAGPTAVDKCNCIPAITETQNYVRHVLVYYAEYKEGGGITAIT